jgi:ABC-type transport system involved in cytochrome bd biosynthesis fused ATPase/permease subunit
MLLIFCQCAISLFERLGNSHKDRVKSNVRALIYEKVTKISHATNNNFGEGQIMGLIDKEASEAEKLFHLLAQCIHMLLNTLITFCYLSYYFGWSFVMVALTTAALYQFNHHVQKHHEQIVKHRATLTSTRNNLLLEIL